MTESSTNTVHLTNPAGNAAYEARFVKVEGDVAGLKSDIGEIKSGVKDIGDRVSARAQPNWHLAALVFSAFTFSIGAVWILFSTYSSHVDAALGEQKTQAARFMSREDIVALNTAAKEIADLKMQIVSGKLDRVAADVADLQTKIVPLSTHQELWATQHEANKALAAQIDENRKAIAGISAPQDTIARIYKRLDDIEARGRVASP